ncbi:VWA domain-containing protein [Ihubacter massiliensis]|uniref:VWA domain-containing protein n=1 Tax=Hominibacterium faecale TaxID=2839743 RepID=A0A9J6QMV0_9FIRM|nr:VWA domain-containing protein [Hominibacterium faecale]MCI7304427.1 VWA domain-containing protein [Clostridia bacterium]MCO7123826.1 VWA domain-containing protein [Ihubacter massiliensis]MDE8733803.1 VWA domain-containing protein [Eubacteriales bacterium DFI.9.88]MDY3011124.1 VWA domain-containing protein [Clostridiales Family XIII bacterium]MCU7378752.1 VWA domain-containing protein [Hominibacterium faecale]
MFLEFFYLLRAKGLEVSINEWMALIEALDKGLCGSSLTGFYHLCRSVLVKSESDYDKFDAVFAEYFKNVQTPEDLPEEFWKWLSENQRERDINDKGDAEDIQRELDELLQMFYERIQEQKEKHDGGNYWIGTGGTSTMGHGGYNSQGIRVGGKGRHKSAVQVAGERNFRDFRQDNILDIRQFQMAFRKLRQYSSRVDGAKTELDIDQTIDKTCDNAGLLSLVYDKPRKNTVKLLLLIDSDGSMLPYSRLCNRLFQAVSKSSHFKDLKVYYFHNCIYDNLYNTPLCKRGDWIDTSWVLSNLDSEYKVIFVGDAAMAPSELYRKGGNSVIGLWNKELGIDWLKKFDRRYKKKIWLNPIKEVEWEWAYGAQTIQAVGEVFPMFELSLDGLEKGIKKLLVK